MQFLVAHIKKVEAETLEEAEAIAKDAGDELGFLHTTVAHDLSALYNKLHEQHIDITDAIKPDPSSSEAPSETGAANSPSDTAETEGA